jgi:hypothetical protein
MNNNLIRHEAAKDKTPTSCIKESKTVPDHPHQAPTLTDIAIFDQKKAKPIFIPAPSELIWCTWSGFSIQMYGYLLS